MREREIDRQRERETYIQTDRVSEKVTVFVGERRTYMQTDAKNTIPHVLTQTHLYTEKGGNVKL